ncbi:MAG: glycosyltransferase [Candidatus Rokuibacteriota bacterium]
MTRPYPFISVIVPVYNGEATIEQCLAALLSCDYPGDCREIIVVDNNSNDQTAAVVKRFPVRCITEGGGQSSYKARNTGIKAATGEILGFTDADCRVDRGWLRAYAAHFAVSDSLFASGPIEVVFDEKRTLAALYDRATAFPQQFFGRRGNFGATANLAVQRELFAKIGLFDERLVSSGDFEFGVRAREEGIHIDFCRDALVYHPARASLRLLSRKYSRIGRGEAQWYFTSGGGSLIFWDALTLLPSREVLETARQAGVWPLTLWQRFGFVLIDWLLSIARAWGNLSGIFEHRTVPALVRRACGRRDKLFARHQDRREEESP